MLFHLKLGCEHIIFEPLLTLLSHKPACGIHHIICRKYNLNTEKIVKAIIGVKSLTVYPFGLNRHSIKVKLQIEGS